jgi:hypothetical protein
LDFNCIIHKWCYEGRGDGQEKKRIREAFEISNLLIPWTHYKTNHNYCNFYSYGNMVWLCYIITLFNVHIHIVKIQNDVDVLMYYLIDLKM